MVKGMTRKGKVVLIILIIVAILIKEEIYAFLFKASFTFKIEENVCSIKNEMLEEKYQELSSAYGYQDLIPYHLSNTKILYRSIYDLEKQITIYKGSRDGLQEKNLIINELGLVGIISKVHTNSSEVELLQNPNLNLSVKINKNYGILKYEDNNLVVKGINNKGNVQEGDMVYTSDISIYPEKILIGKVEKVSFDTYEIEKVIKITPAVDFDHLKYVSVITDLRGQE